MRRKKVPGQRSNVAMLLSSIWAIAALFIIIVGHLVIVFYAYGKFTQTNALADLQTFLPMLSVTWLYALAGITVLMDIWIFNSQKKAFDKQFER